LTTSIAFLAPLRGLLRASWLRGALLPGALLLPSCRPEISPPIAAESTVPVVAPGGQRQAPVASAASTGTAEPAAPAEKPFAVSKEQATVIVSQLSSVVERSAPSKDRPKGLQPQVTVQKEASEHQDSAGRWKSGEGERHVRVAPGGAEVQKPAKIRS
jgi:hypothetical protein